MNDCQPGCDHRRPPSRQALLKRARPSSAPTISIPLVSLAIVSLLLQLGMAGMMPVLDQMAHPAAAAVIMHDCEHAVDKCPTGDCSPQNCDMGTAMTCNYLCVHIPLQSVGQVELKAIALVMADVGDFSGSTPRRLDRPFRPPV